jgi:hypothetical protein
MPKKRAVLSQSVILVVLEQQKYFLLCLFPANLTGSSALRGK